MVEPDLEDPDTEFDDFVWTLVERIANIRRAHGPSRHVVAERMGVGKSSVCNIETHTTRRPRLAVVMSYAQAVGVPLRIEIAWGVG